MPSGTWIGFERVTVTGHVRLPPLEAVAGGIGRGCSLAARRSPRTRGEPGDDLQEPFRRRSAGVRAACSGGGRVGSSSWEPSAEIEQLYIKGVSSRYGGDSIGGRPGSQMAASVCPTSRS